MIGNGGDGGSGFKVEFLVLGVCISVVLSTVEQGLGEVIDVVFAYGVVGKNNRENGNGGGVSVHAAVGASGNGCSCIVRRGLLELSDVLSVHGYQVCLLGGGKVGDSGGGSASNDECCVNLAVLQGISGVSEVLVYSGDVLFDIDAISTKDVYCVEVNAGVGSANGNGLALQVGNGLDVSVAGNDLNLLGVQSCNNGEVLVCCTVEEVGTVVGIGCNVGLAECELCFVAFKGLDVCLGAFTVTPALLVAYWARTLP